MNLARSMTHCDTSIFIEKHNFFTSFTAINGDGLLQNQVNYRSWLYLLTQFAGEAHKNCRTRRAASCSHLCHEKLIFQCVADFLKLNHIVITAS